MKRDLLMMACGFIAAWVVRWATWLPAWLTERKAAVGRHCSKEEGEA
jgi:hypothetical protein